MSKFHALRRPGTNVQIIQQTLATKYSYFIRFLAKYGPRYYNGKPLLSSIYPIPSFPYSSIFPSFLTTEIRSLYVETVQKIFLGYFRAYVSRLFKFQVISSHSIPSPFSYQTESTYLIVFHYLIFSFGIYY